MQKLLVSMLKRPSDSLAVKLITAISGMMLLGGAIVGMMFYKYEQDITLHNLEGHGRFTSALVLRSLKHDMLDASPTNIKLSINDLARMGEINEIVIFTHEGRPAYWASEHDLALTGDTDPLALEVLRSAMGKSSMEKTSEGLQLMTRYQPIKSEPSCLSASCHFHPADREVLGVLKTRISSRHIEGASRQILLVTLVLGVFFILTISFFLFIINYLMVTKPINTIEKGMQRLAEGKFDEPIRIKGTDEVGRLARNFNTMAHDIQRYKDKLENWARELEGEVDRKTTEIKTAQDQLVNAEKLASLGRLAAGVAHEVNNPLTGIVTFAHLMLERCPEDRPDDREDLELIIEQADRCTKIVKGLLGFSRKGSSEKTLCNLDGIIESSYSMVRNQSAFHDIQVTMDFAQRMPHILVDPNQIQQVILNLFTNAADAMNGVGQIMIQTRTYMEDNTEYAEMSFSDTGPGILPEHLSKILEPFFTTKAVGQGTGLGLPVSYGIIKRHGGELLVKSKVGQGTTFIIRIPAPAKDKGAEHERQ